MRSVPMISSGRTKKFLSLSAAHFDFAEHACREVVVGIFNVGAHCEARCLGANAVVEISEFTFEGLVFFAPRVSSLRAGLCGLLRLFL